MKKYLFIGLMILIGTNLAALGGVAYNRMGDATAQLTLTERELALPYNSGAQKESSGISLSINWRTPTGADEIYYSYNSRNVQSSKEELLALGFELANLTDYYWTESRELYWAFEFDGDLHKVEIKKAADKYQAALATYEEQPNEPNSLKKREYSESLEREKTTNSRLFFVEASADYASLANKFSGQQNILIAKGLAKPYYNNNDKTYSLMLGHLLVSNIMVPLEFSEALSLLTSRFNNDIKLPRYAVDIKWGTRLEPWIVGAHRLAN